jgi:hypothetical protein
MKLNHGWLACLSLAALLLGLQVGEAGQTKKHSKPCEPAFYDNISPPVNAANKESSAEDQVVQELVEILNETKSPQTLLATTLALMPMGKKAQTAVPVIIRNAERLKMFGPLKDMSSAKAENATVILPAVMAIQMDLHMTKEMLGFPMGPLAGPRQDVLSPPCYNTNPPSQALPPSCAPMPPPLSGSSSYQMPQ